MILHKSIIQIFRYDVASHCYFTAFKLYRGGFDPNGLKPVSMTSTGANRYEEFASRMGHVALTNFVSSVKSFNSYADDIKKSIPASDGGLIVQFDLTVLGLEA